MFIILVLKYIILIIILSLSCSAVVEVDTGSGFERASSLRLSVFRDDLVGKPAAVRFLDVGPNYAIYSNRQPCRDCTDMSLEGRDLYFYTNSFAGNYTLIPVDDGNMAFLEPGSLVLIQDSPELGFQINFPEIEESKQLYLIMSVVFFFLLLLFLFLFFKYKSVGVGIFLLLAFSQVTSGFSNMYVDKDVYYNVDFRRADEYWTQDGLSVDRYGLIGYEEGIYRVYYKRGGILSYFYVQVGYDDTRKYEVKDANHYIKVEGNLLNYGNLSAYQLQGFEAENVTVKIRTNQTQVYKGLYPCKDCRDVTLKDGVLQFGVDKVNPSEVYHVLDGVRQLDGPKNSVMAEGRHIPVLEAKHLLIGSVISSFIILLGAIGLYYWRDAL
jgi:hypothetical protein